MSKPIYTITALHVENEEYYPEAYNSRTFGFWHKLKEAERIILQNGSDLHECWYNYIILEEYEEGLVCWAKVVGYYKWTGTEWELLNKYPKCFEKVCNFALG